MHIIPLLTILTVIFLYVTMLHLFTSSNLHSARTHLFHVHSRRLDSVSYFGVKCAACVTALLRSARGLIGNTRHGKDPSIGLARHIDVPSRGNGTSSQFARVTCV